MALGGAGQAMPPDEANALRAAVDRHCRQAARTVSVLQDLEARNQRRLEEVLLDPSRA